MRLDGVDITSLANIPSLEYLSFWSQPLQNSTISYLISRLSRLMTLNLNNANISSEAFKTDSPPPSLSELYLCATTLRDDDMDSLLKFSSLQSLNLHDVRLTPKGIDQLKEIKALCRIAKHSANFGLPELEAACRLPSLNTLEIRSSLLSEEGIKILSQTQNLRILNLHDDETSDIGLSGLSSVKQLEEIAIVNHPQVTGRGLSLLKTIPSLSILRTYATPIDDEGLAAISQLPHLKLLEIGDGKTTLAGVNRFRMERPDCRLSIDGKPIP